MDSLAENFKELQLDNNKEESQQYLILPYKNKQWEKNKSFLMKIKSGRVKDVKDLIEILKQMNNLQIDNLVHILKGEDKWITDFIPNVLLFIADLALSVESLFKENEVLILQTAKKQSNNLSRLQVACLLSNMFFLTFENQITLNALPETFDFLKWITFIVDKKRNVSNQQKLVCLLHYFWRIQKEFASQENTLQSQVITFERLINENDHILLKISVDENKMNDFEIVDDRGIELFEDFECIHCDFANKFLGGGVLRTGCVQEEIMLTVTPEALAGILFCQRQNDKDAILITGAQRFCQFEGYRESFKFVGPHYSNFEVDKLDRKKVYTLAMNAISFKQNPKDQYKKDKIHRELGKCFIGFQGSSFSESSRTVPIITGNWGCGVFKGDPQLKLIIQWLSASLLSRKVYYASFKENSLLGCQPVLDLIKNQQINTIYKGLMDFSKSITQDNNKESVFEYFLKLLK
ncbi:hypothetical protein ABPG72_012240 [Tetrahymena utriculariae]